MADIAGSYNSNQSYNPKFVYTISYSQTGRSATAVSYNFNVSMSRTNGSYGYDIIINWNIGGATGSKTILPANNGSASASTSFSVTASTNAAGGTVSAQIWTTSSTDSTHSQNAMNTGARTANKSSFNTAPSISGNVTAAGTTGNAYIGENASTIAVSWPAATDAESNLSGYRLRVSINGGGYTELTRTTSRSYTHTVSSYGEGTTFQYIVDAYDSYSTWSGNIFSGVITKNTLTASTISTSSTIGFLSSNGTITFTVGGGSNTNGSAIAGRDLSCEGATVYNPSVSTGTVTVTVYVSGTLPTGPYIKFSDVKAQFQGSSYQGNLSFRLTTHNNYNNSKSNSVSMKVDLRTNPNPATSCTIVEGAASTAYKTITATGNSYFIPNGSNVIRVTWAGGSGKLGEAITYSLYVAYGSGSWQLVAQGLSSSTTTYDHKPPKQTALTTIKYMIRVVTSYNYSSDLATGIKNLHYYNGPELSTGTITRSATTCAVIVNVNSNSSIPNINTIGTWNCYNTGTTTSVSNGSLTVSQSDQTINTTGLTDGGVYDLKVTFNDNTGFSTNKTITITIPANSPIFFINKYGIGVGGVKASSNYALNVDGVARVNNGKLSIGVDTVGGGEGKQGRISFDSDTAQGVQIRYNTFDATQAPFGLHIESSPENTQTDNKAYLKVEGSIYSGGTINGANVTVGGANVYHTGRKPTLAEISRTLTVGADNGIYFQGDGDYSRIYAEQSGTSHTLVLETADDGAGDTTVIRNWHYSQGAKNVAQFRRDGITFDASLDVLGSITWKSKNIVSSGQANSGWYVRYSDGTQICWGGKWLGTCAFNNNRVNAVYTVEISGGLSTSGFAMTFAANFVSAPYCTASIKSNGFTFCQAASADTTKIIGRAWASYSGTHEGVEYNYVAVGRWY